MEKIVILSMIMTTISNSPSPALNPELSLIPPPTLVSSGTQTSLAYTIPAQGRRSTLRIILDIFIIILGLATIISTFIVIFFLNGLNLLSTPSIISSSCLIIVGLLFLIMGLYFMISSLDQGLVGLLQKELSQAEEREEEYIQEIEALRGAPRAESPTESPSTWL
ncbi:hypothetical protein CpB0177 [Chlamydia pneumoniae TW-183]|uniref:Uncharacterized protein n=4 Tax=Chlamydia pneumoniae TaxID=83558 RepID=A0ABN3YPI0_CHLPN|nr:hypothetical protein CP_0595 [Chlamydia pneumoniae AR39]AAP98110.1 hypothetical protein CpB0177 [Chlamydia pneumoniae TW-183]